MNDVLVTSQTNVDTKVSVRREYVLSDKILLDTVLEEYLLSNAIRFWAQSFEVKPNERRIAVTWVEEGDTEAMWDEVSFHRIAWALAAIAFSAHDFNLHAAYRRRVVQFFQEIDDPDEEFPGGDIDAEIADFVIQVALFSDVRFS